MKRLVVAFAVTLSCTGARSADWTSFGLIDCGQWVIAAGTNKSTYKTWLAGYLSGLNGGHNLWVNNKLDPLDQLGSMDQAYVWMDNWCRTNPLEKLTHGGMVLYEELTTRAAKRR
jgi:hypothetical protein